MNTHYKTLTLVMAGWLTLVAAGLGHANPSLASTAQVAELTETTDTAERRDAEIDERAKRMKPLALYGARADYVVYRDGKKVGNHTLSFSERGNTLKVKVESALTVRVLRIPVFRFRYASAETWVDGRLQSATSTTRENSKEKTVSLRSENGQSLLQNRKGKQRVARLEYTSNHWLMDALHAERIFNTLNGKASTVNVEDLGMATFRTVGGKVEAHQYRYTGGVRADVWYDDAGRWVGLAFKADDDSKIVYRARF